MSEREEPHLAAGQIVAAAAGTLSDVAVEAHLNACVDCRRGVAEWKNVCAEMAPLRASAPLRSASECPSMEDLASFAAGGEPDESIAAHVLACGRCAGVIGEALEAADEPDTSVQPALKTGGREWRTQMAGTFAASAARPKPAPWRYAAAAAIILSLTGLGAAWWLVRRASDPALLLAKAYTAARPFEYRLPDAGYGPLRQERGAGSAFDRPESLLAAEVEIRRRLAAQPEDPEALTLKGRSQLMERDYDGAIESLTRAGESRPDDPANLADLGAAYAIRGDAEKRNIDYGHGVEVFLRALKKDPSNQRVLFNLALSYEKLWLVDEAADTWRKLIELKPGPEWGGEAEKHLAAMEKIQREKKKADDGVLHDPAKFLAGYGAGQTFDPLPYYDVFWTEWLPKADSDAIVKRAAQILADVFRTRFHEESLTESLTAAPGHSKSAGLILLARAMTDNREGRAEAALTDSRAAAKQLDKAGPRAAALLARVELAYALRWAAQRGECMAITSEVLRNAETHYPWLVGTAHLEHMACSAGLGNSGPARAEAANARATLSASGIWPVALRATGFMTGLDASLGNDGPVWDIAPLGLQSYWSGAASLYRAQNFQADLAGASSIEEWDDCASVFYRAAIRSAHARRNYEMEALDIPLLANALQKMGDYESEVRELSRIESLLREAEPGATAQQSRVIGNLRWESSLLRAEAEIATHHAGKVLPELTDLATRAEPREALERTRVEQARGLALLEVGDWTSAEQAFRRAIELNRERAQSLSAWVDRIPVTESAAPSYRNLVQVELRRKGNAAEALGTWLLFRPRATTSASPDNTSRAVIFAVLPAGLAVWSYRGAVPSVRWVDAPVAEIRGAVGKFVTLCASPQSSETEIRLLGNRLFHWLIAPELLNLAPGKVSLVTDSWLTSIPFEALTDDSGAYLFRKYAFLENYGPAGSPRQEKAIAAGATALIVSAPLAIAPGHPSFPVLAGAALEASHVASRFPHAIILRDSTPESIAAFAPRTQIFHFSGHGWSNGGNGALILPPGPDGQARFVTSRNLARQDWSRCELAVLSGCLTATGEERGVVNSQSLVQALLSAGARCVIAARWSVDSEATRAMMDGFYSRLLSGKSVPESLSGAAAEIAATPNWSHPYYWAGFDVFGAA